MKITVLGCPSKPEVEVDVPPPTPVRTVFAKVEALTGSSLAGHYTLHIADATGAAIMEAPMDDSLASLGVTAGSNMRLVPAGSGSPRGGKTLSHKERMIAIYQKYDPSKIGGIDAMLAKFPGREEAVIKKLVEKYGPEPEPEPAVDAPTAAATPTPVAPAPSKKAPPAAALAGNVPPPAPASTASATVAAPRTHRDRMLALYKAYDPTKAGAVDSLLAKHAGKEEQIIAKMVEKYGPEPADAAETSAPAAAAPSVVATPPSPPPAAAAADDAGRARVVRYCERKAPSTVAKVDELLAKLNGNADVLMAKLVAKYGPEDEEAEEGAAGGDSAVVAASDESPAETAPTTAETVSTPAAEPVPPPPPPPPSIDRYRVALTKLVDGLGTQADVALTRGYFVAWRRWLSGRMVEQAVAKGVFEGNGPYAAKDAITNEARLTVKSLEEYYFGAAGTDVATAVSGKLAAAVLAVAAAARACPAPHALSEVAPDLCREGLLVRDTPVVAQTISDAAAALSAAINATRARGDAATQALDETRSELANTQQALGDLRLYVAELEKQAVGDQTELLRLGGVESDLGMALDREVQYQRDIEVLRQSHELEEERSNKMKQECGRLRKELADERRGLPSDMEVLLSQKDSMLASLQQELARLRTRMRGVKEREDALQGTVNEMNERLLVMESSKPRRGASASPRGASTTYASPKASTVRRLTATYSPQYADPYAGGSAGRASTSRAATRLDAAYDPQRPTPRVAEHHNASTLLAEDDDPALDVEVQKRAQLPDRGGCPHCLIPLTAFMGDRYGAAEDASKVAFCFSCRRSFTGLDLARRDAKARSAKASLGAKSLSQAR